MSTELAVEKPESETFIITVTAEVIEQLREKTLEYTLDGAEMIGGKVVVTDAAALIADKEGLKALKSFRMKEIVKARTTCEKEHKAIKEQALRECQRIDKSRRDLVAAIEEIEKPLILLENCVEAELDRIAKEKADKQFEVRRQLLIDVGAETHHLDEAMLRRMDDEEFGKHVIFVSAEKARKFAEEQERLRVEAEQKAERERIAEQARILAEQQKAENERLAALKAELEAQQKEQQRVAKIEQDRLDAQRREQEALLQKQKDELEALRQAQMKAAEDAREAEDRRQQEIRDSLAAQQRELEERERVQREQQEALEAQKLAAEHEQNFAATRAIVEKMQSDAAEVLDPYEKMVVKLPIQEWHRAAAVLIFEWIENPACDNDTETIASMIHRCDPAM